MSLQRRTLIMAGAIIAVNVMFVWYAAQPRAIP